MLPTLKSLKTINKLKEEDYLPLSAQDLSLDDVSDENLMLSYGQDDLLAFNKLYERYRQPLYNYMRYKMTVSDAVLNELFQDVWLKLINSRQQYRVKSAFKTYLYQIANNTIRDYFRRESVRKVVTELEDEAEIADSALLPDEEVEKNHLMKRFRKKLAELPAAQRDVFLLREEAGLTSLQIAEVMGVSVDTVKSRMRYAVSSLKEVVNDE